MGSIRVVGHSLSARAGVRSDKDEPEFHRDARRVRFSRDILFGAGQPGEESPCRKRPLSARHEH
jgi:hypothetical protein